ncbi:MAG: cytochrome c3 family protein [Ignavibacteria bacterium]|nr:cytochrome c3 family protein [Ignavibacteria bacterium]
MKELIKKIFVAVKNYRHPILKLFAFVFLFLIVINVIFYFVSAYSPTCNICHYMKPYYEQSINSIHSDVSCVTCHPSRRILTAPYLLRYIAGSYNPRPRAEVDDEVCLDCHTAQNLKKKTAFEMNISFDHSDHVKDLKRGKELRCTSCHARGEDEHFAVNKNVCFTCHFKGAERGHSVTSCSVCHGSPKKVVEHAGFSFDHEAYLKIGVDCAQCHLDVVSGNAEVEKKRCYQCHVERLEEFNNPEKIHKIHVSKEGVDCEECHNPIQHGKIRMISSLEANCSNCHQLHHTPQREMYIGSEGRGVSSTPSRMFAAQVACEGCHLDLNNDGKSDLNEKKTSCVKCHAQGYDKMLEKWISSIDDAMNRLSPSIDYAKQLVNSSKLTDVSKSYLSDAIANYNLVKEGKGAHNVDYAVKLLNNTADNIEGIIQKYYDKNYKTNRSSILTKDAEYCNLCHFAIQQKNVQNFGELKFPHQRHMKYLECGVCHSKEEHKKITITKSGCEACHKDISKMPERIKFGLISFPHALHSKKKMIECTVCHTSVDFSKSQINKSSCANCHHQGKDKIKDCSKCHIIQSDSYSGIFDGKKYEPDVMQSAGVECESCHLSKDDKIIKPLETVCVDCHDESYRDMQIEWESDVKKKVKILSDLIIKLEKQKLDKIKKEELQSAKRIILIIEQDGSSGIHNYNTMSELLDKKIENLSK